MEPSNNNLITIAHIHTPFSEKFGIPRQSGLVPSLRGEIHFEGIYRNPDAIRGIEEFSHLWLLWGFTEARRIQKATVRPPRLGGQERKGVFATRSPYRPNSIGLSCVELLTIDHEPDGSPILVVGGADLLDGTPVYDIKPYLPYADAHPDARGSFGEAHSADQIDVVFPEELLVRLPEELRESAIQVLAQDPRAAYQKKSGSVYGMKFYEFDIRFRVTDQVLTVEDVIESNTLNPHIK